MADSVPARSRDTGISRKSTNIVRTKSNAGASKGQSDDDGIEMTAAGKTRLLDEEDVSSAVVPTNTSPCRTCKVNMQFLNQTVIFQEVMLAYLCAAILEPVLSLSRQRHLHSEGIYCNLAELFGICWWIYLLNNAFDYADTMQERKYSDFAEEADLHNDWLEIPPKAVDWRHPSFCSNECKESLLLDSALWFQLLSMVAVVTGHVEPWEVVHAWVIVPLWMLLHDRAFKAVEIIDQGFCRSYIVSLLRPSNSLMQLEWILPLRDTFDSVDTLDDVFQWREFIKGRLGVAVSIEFDNDQAKLKNVESGNV